MILYVPRSSETVERDFSISAGLAASTETPGKTAPLWSLTTPVNALCARVSGMSAVKYSNDTNTLMATRHVLDFILLLSCSLEALLDIPFGSLSTVWVYKRRKRRLQIR